VLGDDTFRNGASQLLECICAWDGNWTSDCYIAALWESGAGDRRLVVVNYAPNQSQCYLRLPLGDPDGERVLLRDLMSPASYDRSAAELVSRGLYLDMPAWGYHVFEVSASARAAQDGTGVT